MIDIGKKPTNEEFRQTIKNLVGDEYIFLDDYINNSTEIYCKHNIPECGHEWKIKPNNFTSNGNRCPICCGTTAMRIKRYKAKVYKKLEDLGYKRTSEYISAQEPLYFICPACNRENHRIPETIMLEGNTNLCDYCNEKNTLSKKDKIKNSLVDMVNNLDNTDDYEFLRYKNEEKGYVSQKTRFYIKHKVCGRKFETNYHNLFDTGNRCTCIQGQSRGIIEIKKFLTENSIDFVEEYKITFSDYLKNKPYDIFIPKYNLLIEFQGSQHYECKFYMTEDDLHLRQEIDENKKQLAETYNFNFLAISYKDVKRINTILKNKLNEIKSLTTIS